MGTFAFGADQSLCHHQVDPVHVQDPPRPLAQARFCELVMPTGRVGTDQLYLPQFVGHPHKKGVSEKAVWNRSLVVQIAWLWWIVPELQVVRSEEHTS